MAIVTKAQAIELLKQIEDTDPYPGQKDDLKEFRRIVKTWHPTRGWGGTDTVGGLFAMTQHRVQMANWKLSAELQEEESIHE